MKISIDIHSAGFEYWGGKRAVDLAAEAGFEGLDFSFNLCHSEIDWFGDKRQALAYGRELREYAEARGVPLIQAHAPFPHGGPDCEERRREYSSKIHRAIEVCGVMGIPVIVVHPLKPLTDEDIVEFNVAYYKQFENTAREAGVKLAIENLRAAAATSAEQLAIYEALPPELFTICVDTGHANRYGGASPAERIRIIGSRLGCVHINDNHGDAENDEHFLPGFGLIDWDDTVAALREVGFEGYFNYEIGCGWFANIRRENIPEALFLAAAVAKTLLA